MGFASITLIAIALEIQKFPDWSFTSQPDLIISFDSYGTSPCLLGKLNSYVSLPERITLS